MGFRLLAKSLALNDLERINGRYIGSFHRLCQENPISVLTLELSSVLLSITVLFLILT